MAIENTGSVEQRLTGALCELRALRQDVDDLSRRLLALERTGSVVVEAGPDAISVPADDEDESVWSWVGHSRVLPRVAMVCFVLVVALVLRTLTDSGALGRELGVLLGVAYSALLLAWGWRLLAHASQGRRVLPVCAIALLCTVVFEGHASFGLLTAATANWILVVALSVMTAMGLHYRSASILAFAVLSTSVSALAIGFPHLSFPHAAVVIFAGNVVAYLSLRIGRVQWLSWTTWALALVLWLIWGFQANAFLYRPEEIVPGLFVEWYLPFVAVFALLYAGLATRRAVTAPKAIGAFHLVIPAANVLWAFAAALAVAVPQAGGVAGLAWVACAVAAVHFAIAAWIRRRAPACTPSITSFALAGTILFAFGTPSVLGSFALALPLWSALAVGLIALASVCGSAGLRLSSYALQLLVCGVAVGTDLFAVPTQSTATSVGAAVLLALLGAAHFRYARTHAPAESWWSSRVDRADRLALVLLWCAAVGGFGVLRLLTYEGVVALGSDVGNTFEGAQSVIINVASIALMLWGIRTRQGELLATAVLVAAFGGLKVVTSDLLSIHGVPLVLAVASFGAAAAVGSIVLGKWLGQRSSNAEE